MASSFSTSTYIQFQPYRSPEAGTYTWWHHYADRLIIWGLSPKHVLTLNARQVKKLYWNLKNGKGARTGHRCRLNQHRLCAVVVPIKR